jgi:hypothetical protein
MKPIGGSAAVYVIPRVMTTELDLKIIHPLRYITIRCEFRLVELQSGLCVYLQSVSETAPCSGLPWTPAESRQSYLDPHHSHAVCGRQWGTKTLTETPSFFARRPVQYRPPWRAQWTFSRRWVPSECSSSLTYQVRI